MTCSPHHVTPDRGQLEMVDFERRILPGIGDLVYDQPTLDTFHHFLVASKALKFEVNCTELLFHTITANLRNVRGVASFFKDAQRAGQCHGGAGWGRGHLGNYGGVASRRGVTISSHSLVSTVVGCESFTLAYQIEHYSGTVVLTSRQPLVQMYIKHDML
ncbi:hypothetical protein EMCRGX_G000897 [Ephydatia muelleri]